MIRLLTAGESHGPSLAFILEGIPAGLCIDVDFVNSQLSRRQRGHGRGGRMRIETDSIEFVSGMRKGKTLGSPICGLVKNRDHQNWRHIMSTEACDDQGSTIADDPRQVFTPRPGHADLAGTLKYGFDDIRNVLERASARETAARVAAGAVCKLLLAEFEMFVYSHVVRIGAVSTSVSTDSVISHYESVESSPVRCADSGASRRMVEEIDSARDAGDSIGGVFEIIVTGVPVGLGSHVHFDRRLDARIAGSVMSIPGVKGVELGLGFRAAEMRGSEVHDELEPSLRDPRGYRRVTNNAGGIEGGITNGEPVVVRAAMKPIPTLMKPLGSVDLRTLEPASAATERSDVCAVPAASVVAEAMVAIELAQALCEKCGSDSIGEMKRHLAMLKARAVEST